MSDPALMSLTEAAGAYTRGLLSSTMHGAHRGQRLEAIPGSPPRLDTVPAGCAFLPRCSLATPECARGEMQLEQVGPGHAARCINIRAVA